MNKKEARIRRAINTRYKLRQLGAIRLVVHRTLRHIYAQIISSDSSKTLVSASTLEKDIVKQTKGLNNKHAAAIIGTVIAERSLKKGIIKISFDRSGFKYHGRIQSLADAARKTGLQF